MFVIRYRNKSHGAKVRWSCKAWLACPDRTPLHSSTAQCVLFECFLSLFMWIFENCYQAERKIGSAVFCHFFFSFRTWYFWYTYFTPTFFMIEEEISIIKWYKHLVPQHFCQVSSLFFVEFLWLDQWFSTVLPFAFRKGAASYCTIFTSPGKRFSIVMLFWIISFNVATYISVSQPMCRERFRKKIIWRRRILRFLHVKYYKISSENRFYLERNNFGRELTREIMNSGEELFYF